MVRQAMSMDADTFAFFTRNPRGSRSKKEDLTDTNAAVQMLRLGHFGPVVAHGAYTMNLCTAKPEDRAFAEEILADDLRRMAALPGNFYNFHPGSHVGQGTEQGIEQIAQALRRAMEPNYPVTVLLETMAGKGSEIGRSFEELRAIYGGCRYPEKLRGCFDTCHVNDAGYDIVNDYEGVMTEFDRILGLNQIAAFHINDSKNPRGAHKDRHDNFGKGHIGADALMQIIRDSRFETIPKILETPWLKDPENPKKSTPPYKEEIAEIRNRLGTC